MWRSRTGFVAGLAIASLVASGAATASLNHTRTAGGPATVSRNHFGRKIRRSKPIAYWRLGQVSGSTAYPREGSFPGTYRGAPQLGQKGLITENLNKVPAFDGRNDRVTADRFTSRPKSSWANGYSLEAWVQTTTTRGEEHIISFNRRDGGANIAVFRDEPSDRFKFHDCEGQGCVSVFSKTTPAVGTIYQVVVTVDGSNHGHLYVNGKSEASFTSSMRPVHDARFSIGADYDRGPKVTSFWHGKIDEVAVWDRALPPALVAAQWAAGRLGR